MQLIVIQGIHLRNLCNLRTTNKERRQPPLYYVLNLSLITASSLKKIAEEFKGTKHKHFPHNLLLRDVVIQEEHVLKAIER